MSYNALLAQVVRTHLHKIKPTGLAVYCVILCAEDGTELSVASLAEATLLPEHLVEQSLFDLQMSCLVSISESGGVEILPVLEALTPLEIVI